MEITSVKFEDKIIISKSNQHIVLTPFITNEQGNIKFGITAPKGIVIDREEIYLLKQQKRHQDGLSEE
ncbi:carbon storage regulator [Legionella rowbothamii]|uniref:carbon storage regulator n=1 Tax=Legionella rowbothamii TaxID=96229 RepID=UPI00105653C0|nr:carbon storage regulator [Legionella rowbothamii]